MRFCEAQDCSLPVFSTDKLTKKGYCKSHANKFRTDIDRRTIIQRAMSKQKTLNSKIRGLNVPEIDEKKNLLELWYLGKRSEMRGMCSEGVCNKPTNPDHPKYYHWSVCHVVPKSLVPSVATNPDNFIELCQDHHNEYDSNFEAASKMKCFPEAKRKFELFKHLIPAEEMRKVNPHLLETLKT